MYIYRRKIPIIKIVKNRNYNSNNRVVINEYGVVRQVTNYYPFGGVFSTTAYNHGDDLQPYKYNGKELDRTHGLDWYDYGARNYDATLCQFTTIDPLCEKYYHISPYAYCANNPIKFIDPNGCEFTDAAWWGWVDNLTGVINRRQEKNNAKIAKKQAKLDNGGLSEKKVKRLEKKIENLQNENSELSNVVGEIVALAASDQVYDIMNDDSKNLSNLYMSEKTENSWSTFNNASGVFELHMGNRTLGMLAHELKHAYQFETGAFSTGLSKLGGYMLYDKHDEIEAYARGALFGVKFNGTLPDIYSNLTDGGKSGIDVTNYEHTRLVVEKNVPMELQRVVLQNVANRTGYAFRYNGMTYRPN